MYYGIVVVIFEGDVVFVDFVQFGEVEDLVVVVVGEDWFLLIVLMVQIVKVFDGVDFWVNCQVIEV